MKTATGSFVVSMSPEDESVERDGLSYGRFTNSKTFAGDLVGQSEGVMLTAMTPTKNSAGYVLIEHFSGSLAGRQGSFALQHSSTMARGEPRQSIMVVPDSGTGELGGLTGSMTVEVNAEGHRYTFEYSLSH